MRRWIIWASPCCPTSVHTRRLPGANWCGWQLTGAFANEIYLVRPYSPHVPRAVNVLVNYLREKLFHGFAL